MAIQIINDPYKSRGTSLGAALGQGLGTGLGSALQNLAQQRLNELSKRQQQLSTAEAYEQAGLPSFLSKLSDPIARDIIKYGGPALGQLSKPSLEETMQNLQNMSPGQFAQTMQELQSGATNEAVPEGMTTQPKTVGDLWRSGQLMSPEMRQRQELAQQKLAQSEKLATRKLVQKGMEDEVESGKRAQEMLDTLEQMRSLTAQGKLDSPGFLTTLERLGFDYDVLKSPGTQEYQSLEKEFLRDLKPIFGGRITDSEMKQFLRSIPKATNTPQARNNIINKLEKLYKGKLVRAEAMQNLIEENNGELPHNWKALVEKSVKPQIEELSREFKSKTGTYNTGEEIGLDSLKSLPSGSEAEDDEGNKYMVKNGVIFKKSQGGGWSRMQ